MTNHRVTSILLCALLSSTLGHEYLRVKRFAPEARKSILHSPFQERTLSGPQECTFVCNETSSQPDLQLRLYFNQTNNLLGVLNITSNVALVVDVNANLVALFNGTSGTIVIVNIETNSGVVITSSDTNKVWLKANASFEIFFQSLTSLQFFIDLHVGTTFQIETVSTAIATIVGQLLIQLSSGLEYEFQDNIKVSLTYFLKIGVSFTTLLKGSLNGFLQFAGAGAIILYGDILWLVAVFEGLGTFFGQIAGGLAFLIKAHVRFDIALLLGAASGIELFINLLFAISERVDLAILASILNSTEAFFAIIVQLGGNVSTGATGIFKVIANIIGLINGHIQIDVLLQSLIEFSASKSGSINIQIYWQGLVSVVEVSSANSNSSAQLSGFYSLVTNLKEGKLIIGGINISESIEILATGVQNALQLSITILLKISTIVKASVSIPSLFFKLLLYLNSYYGVALLNKLGFQITFSGKGSVYQQIISGINITLILQYVLTGNLTAILSSLPVIGKIYAAFTAAVSASSNGSFTFAYLLSSSGTASNDILVWIKGILNLGPKPTEPTTTKAPTSGGGGIGISWPIFGGGSISGGISGSGSGSSGGSGSVSIGGSGSVTSGGSGSLSGGASGNDAGGVTVSSGGSGSVSSGGSGSVSSGESGSVSSGGSGSVSGGGSGSDAGGVTVSSGGSGSVGSGGSGSVSGGGSGSDAGGVTVSSGGSGSVGSGGSGSVGSGGSLSEAGGVTIVSDGSGSGTSGGSLGGGIAVGGGSGISGSAGGDTSGGLSGNSSVGGSASSGGSTGGSLGVGGSTNSSTGGGISGSWGFGSGGSSGGTLGGGTGADGGSSSGGSIGISSGGVIGADGGVTGGSGGSGGGSLSWSAKHKSGHQKQHEKEKQHGSHHQD